MTVDNKPDTIRKAVRTHYAAAARQAQQQAGGCGSASCGCGCGSESRFYSTEELEQVPATAAMASLGCGNPLLLADLQPGEVVLDLGSGGGIDVLLSARRVGPTGKAYGLDMTDEMLDLARANAQAAGAQNVEFLKGEIEAIPLPDASVDVILSNCVINLSADKDAVLREAFRVLKPGGRFAVADIVVQGDPMGPELRRALALWAACISGALEEGEYRDKLLAAGFRNVSVEVIRPYTLDDLPASWRGELAGLADPQSRVVSAFVKAAKPGEGSAAYFDEVAAQWDTMRRAFFSDAVRTKTLEMARVEPGKLAVDAGAGSGFVTETLAARGLRVIGVDQSAAMLEEMSRRLSHLEGVTYRLGVAEALPLDDEAADYAFGNMYLHHVDEPAAAIRELVRVLKPGGKLVLTDLDEHTFTFLRTEHHDRWMGFRRADVRQWFEDAGLRDVRVESVGENCCATSGCGCEQASVSIWAACGAKA
ncbi:MAG: arsenite methyltransferase [Anaerolineae bacterium]